MAVFLALEALAFVVVGGADDILVLVSLGDCRQKGVVRRGWSKERVREM